MSEATELVTLPERASALGVFTADGGVQPLLNQIRKHIDAFAPDVTTSKGRKEIASMAYKVAQSKTLLEDIGKGLADEQKAIPKKIDAARKLIKDTLDKWRDEVRQPLTDFEAAEEKRVKAHENSIAKFAVYSCTIREDGQFKTALELGDDLSIVAAANVDAKACEEYADAYVNAKARAVKYLTEALAVREVYEAEQAELVRLRAAQAERDAKEAVARKAARFAAEQARLEQAEADRLAREAEAARQKVILDAALAKRLEIGKKLAAAQATAKEIAEKAAARRAEEAAARVRANDIERKRKVNAGVNNCLRAYFSEAGLAQDIAEVMALEIMFAIVKGDIPNVTINY